MVSENEALIQSFTKTLTAKLAELGQLSSRNLASLENQTKKHQISEQQSLSKHVQMINEHFSKAQGFFQQIEENVTIEDNVLRGLKNEIETASTSFKGEVVTWRKTLQTSSNQLCEEYAASSTAHISLLEESASILHSLVEAIAKHVRTYLKNEQSTISEVQSLSGTAATRETAHLKRQNEILAQMLMNERKHSEKAKADLLQQMSGMLGEFMQKRDDHLRESIGNLQQSNKEVEEILASTHQRQTTIFDNLTSENAQLKTQVNEISDQERQAQAGTIQVCISRSCFMYTCLICLADHWPGEGIHPRRFRRYTQEYW